MADGRAAGGPAHHGDDGEDRRAYEDDRAAEETCFGEGGIMEGAKPGLTLIDMSTISPVATRSIAARLAEKGVGMIDAPVSGGPWRAQRPVGRGG